MAERADSNTRTTIENGLTPVTRVSKEMAAKLYANYALGIAYFALKHLQNAEPLVRYLADSLTEERTANRELADDNSRFTGIIKEQATTITLYEARNADLEEKNNDLQADIATATIGQNKALAGKSLAEAQRDEANQRTTTAESNNQVLKAQVAAHIQVIVAQKVELEIITAEAAAARSQAARTEEQKNQVNLRNIRNVAEIARLKSDLEVKDLKIVGLEEKISKSADSEGLYRSELDLRQHLEERQTELRREIERMRPIEEENQILQIRLDAAEREVRRLKRVVGKGLLSTDRLPIRALFLEVFGRAPFVQNAIQRIAEKYYPGPSKS